MHFISLYWFTTDFPQWIARPLWLRVASYHDIIFTLMYNEIRSQRGQQSILVFHWRLTSEKVNTEIMKDVSSTRVFESPNSGNVRHKPWSLVLSCIGVAFEFIMLFVQTVLRTLNIQSYVCVHVGVWYFNHKQCFMLCDMRMIEI